MANILIGGDVLTNKTSIEVENADNPGTYVTFYDTPPTPPIETYDGSVTIITANNGE